MKRLFQDALLGTKLIWRERQREDFKIFLFSLALAVFCMTILNVLNAAAWDTLYAKAVKAYGGDLCITSSRPIPESVLIKAQMLEFESASVNTLLTMASNQDQFHLVSLKAVGSGYPLQGEVEIKNHENTFFLKHGPPAGTIWVEQGLQSALNIKLNDEIKIGNAQFKVTHFLENEPDAANTFYFIAPRVMMALEDLSKTQIVQAGSRITYELWLSGNEKNLKAFRKWQIALNDPDLTLDSVSEGRSPIQRFLGYAQSYLGLILILIVVLAGLSLSLCARFWVKARLLAFCIYKILGATPNRVVRLCLSGIFIVGMAVMIGMIGLGGVAGWGLLEGASTWFPQLILSFNAWPLTLTFLIALFLLMGFTTPEVWLTKNVLPIYVLQMRPLEFKMLWIFYVFVGLGCIVILYYYTQNLYLTLILAAGIGWAALIAYAVLWLLLGVLSKLQLKTLPLKLAIRQLSFQREEGAAQTVTLTLLITVLLVLYGVRNDFLNRWRADLPPNTPNHFMINIAPKEVPKLEKDIRESFHENVHFYPVVRGRLIEINGEKVRRDPNEPGPEGIDRPLNMTWMKTLQAHNTTVAGTWRDENKGQLHISVEQSFANRLKVKLGDKLTFEIEGNPLTATIVHVREVTWQSFEPNFFVIFPESVLDQFSATYMGSFYVDSNKKSLLPKLLHDYPEVTLIEVDKIINTIQQLLDLLVKGIESLVWIVFLFAFLILYVILSSAKPLRKKQTALLRLVGASQRSLMISVGFEYLILGLLSGSVGSLAAMVIENELGKRIFDLTIQVPLLRYGATVVLSALLLSAFGMQGMRGVTKQKPLLLLRT